MSARLPKKPLCAAFAIAVGALACSQSAGTLTAGVDGAHDLVLVNDLLFITATDDNELRVVDLALEQPNFIRGPNPLHPLSIPVAERPVDLAKDQTFGAADVARFVYARSATGQEISVVGADRASGLKELEARVEVPAGQTITALAARGAAEASVLYYGVSTGQASAIFSRVISAVGPGDPTEVLAEACGAIQSLLVLPDTNQLAFTVRRPRGAFESCTDPMAAEADRLLALDALSAETSFVVDLTSGTRRVLDFGAPMRRLFTHQSYGPEGVIPAGTHIFGLIDEDVCLRPDCRGVLAVDAATGTLGQTVRDGVAVGPMRAIRPELALPMDLALGEDVVLGGGLSTSLVGALTAANGRIYLFDAVTLDVLDTDGAPPSVIRENEQVVVTRSHPELGGELQINHLAELAGRDEDIRVVFRGGLPGLASVTGPQTAGTTFDVQSDPTVAVEVGDVVDADAACGAAVGTTVTAVERRSVLGGRLTFSAPVGGPGCRLSIRPPEGSATPWVVTGSSSGYLGRIAPEVEAQLPEEPARREALHYRTPSGAAPALIHLVLTAPTGTPVLDQTLSFRTASGYSPFSVGPSAEVFRLLNNRHLGVAGAAAFRPGANRLLVSFPSGDLVLQTYPEEFAPGGAITRIDRFL